MRDSFVNIIKELQGNDWISQTPIELNRPHHSNWAGLQKLINQLITNKQLVKFTTQITLLEKTLEEILRDISTQVLETKYVTNLGQLLKIV
jgi:hypothetical protein